MSCVVNDCACAACVSCVGVSCTVGVARPTISSGGELGNPEEVGGEEGGTVVGGGRLVAEEERLLEVFRMEGGRFPEFFRIEVGKVGGLLANRASSCMRGGVLCGRDCPKNK